MILGLIFSVLSVTYTVSSSNTLIVNGKEPMSSEAVYVRSSATGQKGQMTSGNSTTLELIGWDGCRIDSVRLSMHSNTSQGAGSLTMHIGEQLVWKIADAPFNHDTWYGDYTTNWVDINHRIGKKVAPSASVKIEVKASKNSLYIQSYTIYYTLPDPKSYEVTFVSGLWEAPDVMIEEEIGGGVVLPGWVDTLDWRFLGWSEKDVLGDTICPVIWQAGVRYYPKCDCRLWAVYADGEGNVHDNSGESGAYVMANAFWQVALLGGVEKDGIATVPIGIENREDDGAYVWLTAMDESMVYDIDFLSDSTVVIRNRSTRSGIGYKDKELVRGDSEWRYRLLDDGSYCFYYTHNLQQYIMWLGYGKNGTGENLVGYAVSANVDIMQSGGILLFGASETERVKFTSWPFGKLDSVEDVMVNDKKQGEYMMSFGNVVLWVKNGKKMLIVPQI